MIEGIDVVFIHSDNPELADWYREKLELNTIYNDGHWIEFMIPKDSSRFAIDIVPDQPSLIEQQPIIISLRVNDIYTAVNTLINRGVAFYHSESPIFDVGPTLTASFQDPQGNWLQLSQRKIWNKFSNQR